jgi:hypothetical protein
MPSRVAHSSSCSRALWNRAARAATASSREVAASTKGQQVMLIPALGSVGVAVWQGGVRFLPEVMLSSTLLALPQCDSE